MARSFSPVTENLINQFTATLGGNHVITQPTRLDRNSRDAYWYSPVLKKQLDGKVADVIVQPETVEQLIAVLRICVHAGVPIVPQGAGTGNYGQSVPIYGGVLINTRRMNKIIQLTPKFAQVEAGVILHTIEMAAREIGAELRFFPSTLPTSTAAGFLAGGSAGPGSMNWGNLWTPGNILSVSIVTIEENPQTITVTDPTEMQAIIHNCGLTAIITEVTYALAPYTPWQQYVIAFDKFETAVRCGERLAKEEGFPTRLVSIIDQPAPTFFKQLVKAGACPAGKVIMLLLTPFERAEVEARVSAADGTVTWHNRVANVHKGNLELTDFSWNHTTLWAIKADPAWTYLQDGLNPETYLDQLRRRKDKFGDDIIDHIEFSGIGTGPIPGSLTLVRYHSDEQLQAVIDFGESIGIEQYSPHTTYLDEAHTRWTYAHLLDAKRRWDPHGLLNPGHLISD